MGFQQSHECGSRYPQDNTLKTNELFDLPLQWGAQSPTHCDDLERAGKDAQAHLQWGAQSPTHCDGDCFACKGSGTLNGVRNPHIIATSVLDTHVRCNLFLQWSAQPPIRCDMISTQSSQRGAQSPHHCDRQRRNSCNGVRSSSYKFITEY